MSCTIQVCGATIVSSFEQASRAFIGRAEHLCAHYLPVPGTIRVAPQTKPSQFRSFRPAHRTSATTMAFQVQQFFLFGLALSTLFLGYQYYLQLQTLSPIAPVVYTANMSQLQKHSLPELPYAYNVRTLFSLPNDWPKNLTPFPSRRSSRQYPAKSWSCITQSTTRPT